MPGSSQEPGRRGAGGFKSVVAAWDESPEEKGPLIMEQRWQRAGLGLGGPFPGHRHCMGRAAAGEGSPAGMGTVTAAPCHRSRGLLLGLCPLHGTQTHKQLLKSCLRALLALRGALPSHPWVLQALGRQGEMRLCPG